jgi:NADPH:quinone reductase-like Zn-dependent oxidoreductase
VYDGPVRAALIHHYKDALRIEEIEKPSPGPRDLLIKVRAASVNPVDFKIRDGGIKVLIMLRFPLVLGNDCSGVVEDVGAEVTAFKRGDSVWARLDKDRIGGFAEWALVSEGAAAPKPAGLDYIQAASLPLVGLTAWQALVDLAHLGAGQRVLIHAGSGGVGTAAIQLAKHLGAHVVTTASTKNAALLEKLGADQVIDYRTQRFEEHAGECDAVLDTQGGETLLRSFQVVKRGGVVVTVGGVPDAKFGRAWGLGPLLVLGLRFMTRKVIARARARGARFEYLFMRADGAELREIGKLAERGVIEAIVDRTFPFEQVVEALAYVEKGRAVGKVVVTFPE